MTHHLKSVRVVVAVPAALLLVLTSGVASAQDANRVTVPFSDPSRPGTVKVNQFQGSIRVTATTGREVIVTTDDTIVTTRQGREVTVPPKPEVAGLRRLTQRSGLRIEEDNNVISIGSGRFYENGADVRIQVPARTNLNLSAFNDEISVEGIEGEIEVNSMNGEITLTNVAGSVVAHATNGDVHVTLRQVTADKPMSFTSLNGDVDVTLPPAVKANLKLRSDRGEVYTDFDVQIQQQRASASPSPGKPFTFVAPPQPPLPPLPPLPPADPSDAKARERDARERERQARERERQAQARERQAQARAKVRFDIDSGIYGTVNGGGPEFELRTFNGDVIVRRAK